jgi:hypothetical protein
MQKSLQEQRHSSRLSRRFWVTDYDDEHFQEPFEGIDVNLTGLSFVVEAEDLFFPQQVLSLRVKNLENDEVYCLEAVELVHQQPLDSGFLCGCHLTQVSSAQLLAHHRLAMPDAISAHTLLQASQLEEFDFVAETSRISSQQSDFQQAGMALSLAVSQLRGDSEQLRTFMEHFRSALQTLPESNAKTELQSQFERSSTFLLQMTQNSLALGMLAKLLSYTPSDPQDRQAWQTLVADFEGRFLSERQQIAYDFMHQGLTAEEALLKAQTYVDAFKV